MFVQFCSVEHEIETSNWTFYGPHTAEMKCQTVQQHNISTCYIDLYRVEHTRYILIYYLPIFTQIYHISIYSTLYCTYDAVLRAVGAPGPRGEGDASICFLTLGVAVG